MPKVFVQAVIRSENTYRVVIDGQQRIKAILSFLNGDLKLGKPYTGEFENLTFDQLPSNIREEFLSYKIDINEIRNAPDDVVRDIYSRVNKYTVALNKQELRRADFPGEFLKLSEELAREPFFDEARVFTVANSRRMGDVEFVSELLALLLEGPQEKRERLDDFYQTYMEWDSEKRDSVKNRFVGVLEDFRAIFQEYLNLAKSRFRQKADFYSLFAAIDECRVSGGFLEGKPLEYLRADFDFLDDETAPESDVRLLSHYAVLCVSQGNSLSSRRWRRDFLKHFLHGTYFQEPPSLEGIASFAEILIDRYTPPMCQPGYQECPVCGLEIKDYSDENVFLTWHKSDPVYQLNNALFIHQECREAAAEEFFLWNRDTETLKLPFEE